jgi:two-component system response regulator AtoC
MSIGQVLSVKGRLADAAPHAPTLPHHSIHHGLVIADPVMAELDATATAVASGTLSVLLLGETGSGKEVFAENIHRRSPRRDGPFVPINCAALSETLLESELFGHERGAFTGAVRTRPGLLQFADGGTLLLDEVGEMPAALQAKLLRVLESRQVTRVGANRGHSVDIRVISATNRDLEGDVQRGSFRKDLYYRLCGAVLRIPPLRERLGEVEPLARLFLQQLAREAGRAPELTAAAVEALRQHDWPGNVRELRNVMERAVLMCAGPEIRPEHLSLAAARPERKSDSGDERIRVTEALDRCAGNQTRAAQMLGISRGTLISRLTEFGLPRPRRKRR